MSDREVKTRQTFKKWATDKGFAQLSGFPDHFIAYDLSAWSIWQAALASRDSTPTEGVGKRVVDEWRRATGDERDWDSLAQRIDRVAAPRMTLDFRDVPRWRFPPNENLNYFRQPDMISAIRAQLPNVDIITDKETT